MTALVWIIHHATPIFWSGLTLLSGAWCYHQVRRELTRPHTAPRLRRTRYPRSR